MRRLAPPVIGQPVARPLCAHAARAALAALLCVAGVREAASQAVLPTGFTDQLVVGGLDYPTGLAFLPDGRLLFVELNSARFRLVVNGALAATDPVATVPDVAHGGERGLLGIAVDPGFPARPYVYVHCDDATASVIRVTRFTVGGDLGFTGKGNLTIDLATRRDVINDVPDTWVNHNGGTLRFGKDGMLYASFGEDGMNCAVQDTSGLLGVILRMDVSGIPAGGGPAPSHALIAPPDNPFAGGGLHARLIWVFGLRNPFRFHIDPLNGALFIADVGAGHWEEIDRAPAGGLDFGWERFEGPMLLDAGCALTMPETVPIYAYPHPVNPTATISAGIYRVPRWAAQPFPGDYDGDYFFSEYYSGFMRRLKGSGTTWSVAPPAPGQADPNNWATGLAHVTDYLVGPDGSLWYCRQFEPAEIRRIVHTSTTAVPGPPAASDPQLAAPWPSPASGDTHLSWTVSGPTVVSLSILDLGGRVVRRLVAAETETARAYTRTWDGRDDRGRLMPAGVYRARLTAGGRTLERTITRVR